MKTLMSALVAGVMAAGAVNAAEIDFTDAAFATTFPGVFDQTVATVEVDGVEFTIAAFARGTNGFRQTFDSAGLNFGVGGNGMSAIAITANADVTYTAATGADRSIASFSSGMLFDLDVDGMVALTGLAFGTTSSTIAFPEIAVGAGTEFLFYADFSARAGFDSLFASAVLSGLTFETETITDPTTPVPLPAGLPLMLAGLGALGIVKRRKS